MLSLFNMLLFRSEPKPKISTETSELLQSAVWALKAKRYDDMVKNMKAVVEGGDKLSDMQRELLNKAYKLKVDEKRFACRVISKFEQEYEEEGDDVKKRIAKKYRHEIETEILSVCAEMVVLLNRYLIPSFVTGEDSDETKVFYLKIKGDFYRYQADIINDDSRELLIKCAQDAYEEAYHFSQLECNYSEPIYLELCLNYSLFLKEIADDTVKATEVCQNAWDEAHMEMGYLQITKEQYNERRTLLQPFRENIMLWNPPSEHSSEYETDTDEDNEERNS